VFVESQPQAPEQIIVDVDTTDVALHGKQEGRFFHGYYDSYCYLPLYIFCGEHVLCARLREANHDASFGCLAEIRRIVAQIRASWPEVKIILRGDSGFCRNELMNWCEQNGVEYVFGLARNQRLRRIIEAQMHPATQQWSPDRQTGAGVQRVRVSDQEDQEGWLGSRAAGSGESGTHRRERESPFRVWSAPVICCDSSTHGWSFLNGNSDRQTRSKWSGRSGRAKRRTWGFHRGRLYYADCP
jgi:hypothetical protein